MPIIADLHIHSRHSGACSKAISIANLEKYAKIKGLGLLGTGDFTHPQWIKELNSELEEDDNGVLWTKNKFPFIWQTEVSLVYTQDGKGRRVHHLILAPSKDVVGQITEAFLKKGRIDYDGRPIFGFTSIELVDMMREISSEIEIIPAHVWTPWYSIFGSKSGFDSVEECFGDKNKYIHAIETGLSSDPAMNRRVSKLDKYNLVSFSDLHSFWPWRIGREATVFDVDLKYKEIVNAIRTGKGLKETIEVSPEYGKYHFDGHRNCGVVLNPEESKKLNGICPKCKNPLTIGVQYRVDELADREEGYVKKDAVPYKSLIPLTELIGIIYDIKLLSSKKVWDVYNKVISNFGSEFNVLLNVSFEDLCKVVDEKLARLIIANREAKLEIKPGYDGVYGELVLEKEEKVERQAKLI